MEHLLPVINKLQDVFNTVGEGNLIQLPQIVVVGAQSSGKSSVLENVVGWDFLPRGTGIVTRVPLIIQLVNIPAVTQRVGGRVPNVQSAPNAETWATFLHQPEKVFIEFDEVRKEIEAETDRLVGSNKNVADKPITVKIFSPHVLNLTLVDLPGITKVPIEGQPKDIEQQIRDLVLHYIRNPNSIILAVSAANVDIANSDSIQIAREIDPEGNRTIGVCTKLDLMDRGTNALDVLSVVKLKLGIIGVVNRSQYDIEHKKSIKDSVKSEMEFFQSNYPTMATRCGTSFLTGTLNRVLLTHIRKCLPDLRLRIKTLQKSTREAMLHLGRPPVDDSDKSKVLLSILTNFSHSYCASINGTGLPFNSTHELSVGALICKIFIDKYGHLLEEMDAMEGLTEEVINTTIRNATGTRRAIFVPELAFEELVKRQIGLLEEPSLRCVEQVYEELERLMHSCSSQELAQFRNLREKVLEVVSSLLRGRIPATTTMVTNLVSIERAYINTSHPDFGGGNGAFANLVQPSNTPTSSVPPMPHATSQSLLGQERPSTPEPSKIHTPPQPQQQPQQPQQPPQQQGSQLDQQPVEPGLFQFFGFGRRNLASAVPSKKQSGTPLQTSVSERDFNPGNRASTAAQPAELGNMQQMEVDLVSSLVRSYFVIVRKNIQDAVPKTIMCFMVNYIMENIHNELVSKLFSKDQSDFLLQEDPHIAGQRKRAMEMMDALDRASTIISEVYDSAPGTA